MRPGLYPCVLERLHLLGEGTSVVIGWLVLDTAEHLQECDLLSHYLRIHTEAALKETKGVLPLDLVPCAILQVSLRLSKQAMP